MYNFQGKGTQHGSLTVIGVNFQYGRGKHQVVHLVSDTSEVEYPITGLGSLFAKDKDNHRFFISRELAEAAATTASRDGKRVKDLRGSLKGNTQEEIIRKLQTV
ncbi:hypothetical protein D3C81_727290 [compost metagenome]